MNVAAKLARNSFFQFWTVLVTGGSGLVLSIVLARGLGPEQYGSYAFFIWLLSVGAMLANLGLNSMSNKFIAEYRGAEDHHGVHVVLQIVLRGRILAAVVVAIALILISMVLMGDSQDPAVRFYPLLISLALVPYALRQAFQGIVRGFERYDYSAYPLIIALLAKTLIAVVLVQLGYGILHLLVLEVFTWTVAAVLGLLLMRRLLTGQHPAPAASQSREAKLNMARFAAVAMVLVLVDFVINQRSEIFFLKLYRTAEEVGFYNLAFSVSATPMLLVPGALGLVLMPTISEQFGRRDMARVAAIYVNSARYLMLLAFPLAAGGIVMARPLIVALFGEPYTDAILPAQILFISAAVTAISLSNFSVLFGTNRPQYFLLRSLFLIPANIILAMVLIPRYGVVGAALAHNAGLLVFPVTVWYVSTRLKIGWPYKDTVRIIVATFVMAGGVMLLRNYLQASELIPMIILLGAGLYLIQLLVLRVLRREDFKRIAGLWGRFRFAGWAGQFIRRARSTRP